MIIILFIIYIWYIIIYMYKVYGKCGSCIRHVWVNVEVMEDWLPQFPVIWTGRSLGSPSNELSLYGQCYCLSSLRTWGITPVRTSGTHQYAGLAHTSTQVWRTLVRRPGAHQYAGLAHTSTQTSVLTYARLRTSVRSRKYYHKDRKCLTAGSEEVVFLWLLNSQDDDTISPCAQSEG